MKDQIWLTGFMGTGKTRIARPLAAALDWDYVDVDALIEEEARQSIPAIFGQGGEAAFRALEAQIIVRTAERHNVVIATGGGSVLSSANRDVMKKSGFIVLLDALPQTIARRIVDSGKRISDRPLLAGGDPIDRISELKTERDPIYMQLADFVIQTDELTPDQITHQVLTAYRESTAVAGGTA
jgi:shikimate kinase